MTYEEKPIVRYRPNPSDVRDTLIVDFCEECPDHDEDGCGNHKCFVWGMFGIIMDAEK